MTVIGDTFIFVHVPKSAGQSVTSRLGGLSKDLPSHAPLFHIAPELRARRYAFGFARNPWDRMVSLYTFMCTKKIKPHESATYQANIRSMGFEEWLMTDRFYMHQDKDWATDTLPPMQRRSQMFWLNGCDFIGQVETLSADFAQISRQIDRRPGLLERVGLRKPIPHRNRSPRASYQSYYSDQSRAFVSQHFAPEIDMFGYSY